MVKNSPQYKKASAFTRFFWNACGTEIEILEYCGNNDRVKYFCLGGIVIATGLMAGFAGGYAFYTIFQPKGYVLKDEVHLLTAIFSIFFGALWGLMIFNLDRYIVSSSGIGDGTDKITWPEFWRALPRIIMGIIIAITISKPVEIRIFKTEIDNALYKQQLAEKAGFTEDVNARSERRRKQLEDELGVYNKRVDAYNTRIDQKDREAEEERLRRGGRGAETNRLEAERDAIRAERNEYISGNAERIRNIKSQMDKINADARDEMAKGDEVASKLDGLLQRIKLAHEEAGWLISLFITLLFVVIELTPIFFKMMVNISNYDIMLDEYKKNILIKSGLVPDHLNSAQNVSYKNILREEHIRQLAGKVELQKEVFDLLLEKYKTELRAKIEEDYTRFVRQKAFKIDMLPEFQGASGETVNPQSPVHGIENPNIPNVLGSKDTLPSINTEEMTDKEEVLDNPENTTEMAGQPDVEIQGTDHENVLSDRVQAPVTGQKKNPPVKPNPDITGPDFEITR